MHVTRKANDNRFVNYFVKNKKINEYVFVRKQRRCVNVINFQRFFFRNTWLT